MEKYILDTNLFFNMQAGIDLGKNTKETIESLTGQMKVLKSRKLAEFYMPPRIVEEFLSFFENKNEEYVQDFLSTVIVKSPTVGTSMLPATVFYSIVDEIRKRSYRGLNIAEEEIEKAGQEMLQQQSLDKKDFQIKIGAFIKKFRDRYRNATRYGFLDSVADLDVIVLAKELDGTVVSTDEGVIYWARLFGVREALPDVWKKQLSEFALHHSE
jgi:RNA ligase partner protein